MSAPLLTNLAQTSLPVFHTIYSCTVYVFDPFSRAIFESWRNDVGHPGSNPFWAHQIDDKPLDIEDPVIDITLLPFVGRSGYKNFDVALTTSDKILYQGTMANGRLRGVIDKNVAKLSDWNAPLTLRYVKQYIAVCSFMRMVSFQDVRKISL